MVGQSTKTFPSHPSSRREPGDACLADGGGSERTVRFPPSPQHGSGLPGQGGGVCLVVGFFCLLFCFFLVLLFSVVEVTAGILSIGVCTQLPCHSAVTLHLLATEQKALRSLSRTAAALSRRSRPSKLVRLTAAVVEEKSVEWTVDQYSV